jgi:hypothetical protein
MNDEADVRNIDAYTKRAGSNEHPQLAGPQLIEQLILLSLK